MQFRKQASKDSTECNSTDEYPTVDIVSDELLG